LNTLPVAKGPINSMLSTPAFHAGHVVTSESNFHTLDGEADASTLYS
jgi:hypothetical protein